MTDETQDRRRAERVPVNAEFADLGDDMTFVSDLSEHGVFVHTRDLIAVGSVIDVRFTVILEDPILLVGRGRVARHQQQPQGMGIEFFELSAETILRINDVIARSRPRDLTAPLSDEELDSAQTVMRPRPPELLSARVEASVANPEDDPDFENWKTLVALRPVDAEIVDESGDGSDEQEGP